MIFQKSVVLLSDSPCILIIPKTFLFPSFHHTYASGLVSRKLEQKQQQVEDQTERIQMLQASINSITSEKLRLTMMVQQEEKLQEQQAELKSTIQTFQREIKVK